MNICEVYMKQALIEAKKAFERDEVPVGAVIVFKDEIIARAHNQIKMLRDPTAHAEMIAITQASAYFKSERLNGCDLYVTIEPCSMCVGASVLARLRTIIFGSADVKTGACGSVLNLAKPKLFNHSLEVISGILEQESRTLIQDFFLKKRQ